MIFRALNKNVPIKDPKVSRLTAFHGYAEKYGWTFSQIEEELGLKLNIPHEELSMMLKGIYAGEARFYRRKTK